MPSIKTRENMDLYNIVLYYIGIRDNGYVSCTLLVQCYSMQVLGRPDNQFYGWRILFAVPLLFAIFQVLTLPLCPESPRFLYIKKKDEQAAIKGIII